MERRKVNIMNVNNTVEEVRLVPVVVIDDAADAIPTAEALKAGGVPIMEITLRTKAGLSAIEAASEKVSDIIVGAGTVLTGEQAKDAISAGAKFIVLPGFDAGIVSFCLERGVSVFPGCVTPTEIMAAMGMGLNVLKFFPANVYGGIKAIKALSGPFPGVRFMPTGGVDGSNLKEYLIPQVFAVGGGWLCARADIKAKNFSTITKICEEATNIVKDAAADNG
jgi:2-dehydro-3-deoxyphosphogluconate aldolase/(4S)-4-hydroxy-2-oxoglutarate aldolase